MYKMQEYYCARANRFPAIPNQTMPGLVMSNPPTAETPRRSTAIYNPQTTNYPPQFTSPREQLIGAPMTISASAPGGLSANGSIMHGGASSAMMSAANGRVLPIERLRLRDWLIRMIETKGIHGLCWLDKERQIVKIPWKHAARHGWSRDKDACLFRAWAVHTKKYDPKTDTPKANPKVWKANFRCAINSLPDIEELREKGKSKGNDAYKVYRLHPKKSKRHNRDGQKIAKRQRSSSRTRSNRSDRKQQRKLITSESGTRVPSHTVVPKTENTSLSSLQQREDLKKRMADITDYSNMEAAKRDGMSLNLHCVFKPTGGATTVPSSYSTSSLSSASSIKSPATPYTAMTTSNGIVYPTSNSNAHTAFHHPCVSPPCSTTTSTPASTPQSPPPPYQVALSQRQRSSGPGSCIVEVGFEVNHPPPAAPYDYNQADEYSDSDCSNMTEAEVAQMVLDIKDQSPGNSPRCLSPLDGNNNAAESQLVAAGNYWTHKTLQQDGKYFFGTNFDTMSQTNQFSNMQSMAPQIKVEPDIYPAVMPQHSGGLSARYAAGAYALAMSTAAHNEEMSDGQAHYLLQQL